jgi:tRNA(Ile)-lysidine synthase
VAIADEALREEDANALFSGLAGLRGLVLAVSGGPDSTALLVMAADWAKRLKRRLRRSPKLVAVTIDHGLRPQSRGEAAAVKKLAQRLGVAHRTVCWRGEKPKSGLQAAAREARYRLLAQQAARAGFAHIVTAHTLDDQAETLLFRLARGSGLSGLVGMAPISPLPAGGKREFFLLRPLLSVPKARLVATLNEAGIDYTNDPSNRDPRFARTRLRALLPQLAAEGLDAKALARLGARMRRAESALEFAVGAARTALAPKPWRARGPIVFPAGPFGELPAEVALRLLGRAIAHVGNEGPVELGKLEMLYDSLRGPQASLRRTLAGALISLGDRKLIVERAPPRRTPKTKPSRNKSFTK